MNPSSSQGLGGTESVHSLVTAVMTTYANSDFTNASTWAMRRFYPKLRILYVDGHPTTPFDNSRWPNTEVIWRPGANINKCFGDGAGRADTKYLLFMDNDAKVTRGDAIPICLEAFKHDPLCAVSGWYALKVTDWDKRSAIVGTEFRAHVEVDAIQATFAIHSRDAFTQVGGFPWEPFWDVPPELWRGLDGVLAGVTGDYAICKRYTALGWKCITPQEPVPILHWTQAICWYNQKDESPFDRWYHANTHHTRMVPFPGGLP